MDDMLAEMDDGTEEEDDETEEEKTEASRGYCRRRCSACSMEKLRSRVSWGRPCVPRRRRAPSSASSSSVSSSASSTSSASPSPSSNVGNIGNYHWGVLQAAGFSESKCHFSTTELHDDDLPAQTYPPCKDTASSGLCGGTIGNQFNPGDLLSNGLPKLCCKRFWKCGPIDGCCYTCDRKGTGWVGNPSVCSNLGTQYAYPSSRRTR